MRRALLAAMALGSCAFAAPPALAGAAQEDVNRAVVVVDLGNGDVRSACVRFRQQSITGVDLLRAARMDPVVQTYSGQGGAVCKLCGVGCSAGSSCLTCKAPTYWQYWRSDGGTGTYTYSQRGAGTSEVTDGDVEGWSWSDREDPPPFLTIAEACSGPNVYDYEPAAAQQQPPASTTTTSNVTSPTAPPSSPTTVMAPASTSRPARAGSAVSTTLALPPTTALAESTSTTSPDPADRGQAASAAAPHAAPDGAPSSSRAPGLAAFAVVLAAIVGVTLRLRWARRRA